jgi:hypothetical protein
VPDPGEGGRSLGSGVALRQPAPMWPCLRSRTSPIHPDKCRSRLGRLRIIQAAKPCGPGAKVPSWHTPAAQRLACRRRWGALSWPVSVPRDRGAVGSVRRAAYCPCHLPSARAPDRRSSSTVRDPSSRHWDRRCAIKALGVKAQRIRHPQYDHPAILEGDQTIN